MIRFLILFSICFILISCKKESSNKVAKTQKIEFKHEGNLTITDSLGKIKKNIEIEFADNDYKRQTGLMYRTSLKENRGMLFVFNKSEMKSFYMKNTYIPLDIIFIDTNYKIINISKNAQPLNEQSVLSNAPAKYVLEINAGFSSKWNLKNGDSISFSKLK